jgi:spoIIIJ-associated protein
MAEEENSIELSVAGSEVDESVRRVCAEWGVERSEVQVAVFDTTGEAGAPGMVRVKITRVAPDAPPSMVDGDAELETARQVLVDLLNHMGVEAQVHATRGEPDGDVTPIELDVQGPDLGLLIGRKGDTVAALQYIARLIIAKQVGHGIDLVVDVQGHKKRREEQLRRIARRMAEQAVERGRTMTMEPMAPNERRIVHLELRDHPRVTTESVGEGNQRKVTIVPREAARA